MPNGIFSFAEVGSIQQILFAIFVATKNIIEKKRKRLFDKPKLSVLPPSRQNLKMSEPFINKIAESGLITLDLEKFIPKGESIVFDLKEYLFMEMILKEKDFREALKNTDWEKYKEKNVAVVCSADAIIPVWAYMLAVSYLEPVAREIIMGDEAALQKHLFIKNIEAIDINEFADKRMVIKGCGEIAIPDFVYMEITKRLRPVVKSIMYGEPCSTVPVYKKR